MTHVVASLSKQNYNCVTYVLRKTFILEGLSLISPEREEYEKREFINKGWGTEGFYSMGVQTCLLSWFYCKIFPILTKLRNGQRSANNEKGVFSQLPIWMRMRQWGISAWGIQTGPLAAHSAHCILKFFPTSHFPFLLPQSQRANNEKGEIPIWMRLRGSSAWGIQPGPFVALWANFVLKLFNLLHFHTEEPIPITAVICLILS